MKEKRFTMRMHADLFEYIREQAHLNKRSVANEIEYVLENAYEHFYPEEEDLIPKDNSDLIGLDVQDVD